MTVKDIEKLRFKRTFMGYNPIEVDKALEDFTEELNKRDAEVAEIAKEKLVLGDRVKELEEKLEELSREIDEHRAYEEEAVNKIDDFKSTFMSLYHRQIDALKLLPDKDKNDEITDDETNYFEVVKDYNEE